MVWELSSPWDRAMVHIDNTTGTLSTPKSQERGHFLVGEDYWDLDFDGEFAHFVWCDSRPGFLATWYGRVPLSEYGAAPNAK